MITAYNVVSSDGFIALENGSEDFIPNEIWDDFLELCGKFDALLMGQNTYDTIQGFEEGLIVPFEKLKIKKVVITRDENFLPKVGYLKITSIADAIKMGENILLSSGPSLNTSFLKEKLIDLIILNRLPVAIGKGIPQFNIKPDVTPLADLNNDDGKTLEYYKVNSL